MLIFNESKRKCFKQNTYSKYATIVSTIIILMVKPYMCQWLWGCKHDVIKKQTPIMIVKVLSISLSILSPTNGMFSFTWFSYIYIKENQDLISNHVKRSNKCAQVHCPLGFNNMDVHRAWYWFQLYKSKRRMGASKTNLKCVVHKFVFLSFLREVILVEVHSSFLMKLSCHSI